MNMKQPSAIRSLFARLSATRLILGGLLSLLLLASILIKFNLQGDLEGLYVLRGSSWQPFELRDDIYLGESERVLARLEFRWLHDLLGGEDRKTESHLKYSWNSLKGHGYILDRNPDGTDFIVCLSRFIDSSGKMPQGIFIGGELPQAMYDNKERSLNETGMAFKQGDKWYHIWCNANEGIASAAAPGKMIYPSEWEFLGSKVLFSSKRALVLKSSHQTTLDGVPTQIDRFLFHKASSRFVVLAIRIKNVGDRPTGYYYVYGDEPWLGDYGTSIGNVGWSEGKLHHYADVVDPIKNSTAGMADLGNPLSPYEQGRNFSGLANFISWLGMSRPAIVYFANKEGVPHPATDRIALDSPNNRVIFCQWGPVQLQPQQADTILLAIGMADRNPKTGLPTQPQLNIDWDSLNHLMEQ